MSTTVRQAGRAARDLVRPLAGFAGALFAVFATAGEVPASDRSNIRHEEQMMHVRDLYPLITTPALFDARDFYTRHFGFNVLFEASWFVYLSGPADGDTRGATLAFMHPEHPSNPPGPEAFDGRGMILTIEVSDAEKLFGKLSKEGAPIVHPLTDEEWGQRRFMTRDPAGVLVDVVQQIEPKAGFWERYPAPAR
jgi:uncharacterized glyoxalase superfamily protein PhnB